MKRSLVLLLALLLILSGCATFTTSTTTAVTTKAGTVATTPASVATTATTARATTAATTTVATTAATTMSPAQLEAAFKTYEYKDVARLPDTYIAKFMKITGEVIQVMENGSTTSLRIIENSDYDKTWYVLYSRPDKAPRILEKDIVTVYGVCIGLYSYKSTSGATISIPGITGIDIKIVTP